MVRILLLEDNALPLHQVRIESRRSGVPFLYGSAATKADLDRHLAYRPAALVSTLSGFGELSLAGVAERAREADVPLLLVGGDTKQGRDALLELSGSYAASCRRSRLAWLPLLIERIVREADSDHERRAGQRQAETQLRQAAEQMREVQKMSLLGRLTGSIVHEINNPLESLCNLVYLLRTDDLLPDHLRTYVNLAEQELDRVTRISTQTLSFCRETQTPVRVELSSLFEEALLLYSRRLAEKQIEVMRRFESEEPLFLFPGEMRQVFANLLANAIDATPEGGRIVVRLRLSRRRNGHGVVDGLRLLIADSGSGMPREVVRQLGQPFFTTKGHRGTGLGLWVSQSIVARWKGTIQLRSSIEEGRRGTTFSVFLPLNLRPHKVELAPSSQKTQQMAGDGMYPLDGLRMLAGSS